MTKFARDGYDLSPEMRCHPETTGFQRAKVFHEQFGLPVNEPGYQPTEADRLLRGKLMLEEVLEFLNKGLGLCLLVDGIRFSDAHEVLDLAVSGSYDPVETLDGIADIKVIANGTGVVMGLPVEDADWEVFCSNMSKLDENGSPIVNGETPGYCACDMPGGGYRADLPVGKVLKSDSYVPANIAGLITPLTRASR
jgi:hypothetical protein